jgi:hypothetical protein
MFWFKRKTITVDAFTNQAGVAKHYPIQKSAKFLPEWWKQLPKSNKFENAGIEFESSTMKRCIGFIDLYKNSFIVPFFTELKIKNVGSEWQCITAAGLHDDKGYIEILSSHTRDQYGPEFDSYNQFKILMPWILQEKTGVNFYLGGAYWNQPQYWQDLYFASGFLNFKYQSSINISFFASQTDKVVTLMPNQPLAYLIPITEHDVEIKTHDVTNEEYRKKLSATTFSSKFVDRYKFNKKLIDEQEQQQKKCPFGFGK